MVKSSCVLVCGVKLMGMSKLQDARCLHKRRGKEKNTNNNVHAIFEYIW
jgi:hypothetical protein